MKKIIKKRWLRVICYIFSGFVFVFSLFAVIPPQKSFTGENKYISNIKMDKRPYISAHQGAEDQYPSNTYVAFAESLRNYGDFVTSLEFDIRTTKDGKLVLQHDESLVGRTNINDVKENGKVLFNDYTFDWLNENVDFAGKFKDPNGKSFDYNYYKNLYPEYVVSDNNTPSGYRVKPLLLETFLDTYAIGENNKYINLVFSIEIKDVGEMSHIAMNTLNKIIKQDKYKNANLLDRIVIASFHDDNFKFMKENYPEYQLSASTGVVTDFVIKNKIGLDIFFNEKILGLQIPVSEKAAGLTIKLDSKRLIRRAHKHNMMVQYWTIDEVDEIKRLIKNGADCIITNRLDNAKIALEELGLL